MQDYSQYVLVDCLISPVTGYKCKRLTKQNIKLFGFNSITELHDNYPTFPTVCQQYMDSIITNNINRKKGSELHIQKVKLQHQQIKSNKELEYNDTPKLCRICNNAIPFTKQQSSFCGRSCANIRHHSEETKQQIRKTIINLNHANTVYKLCHVCSNIIIDNRNKTCSRKCSGIAKTKVASNDLIGYRRKAAFRFSLNSYPTEFNFDLIETYGWYSPSNKNNNMCGVSRDHMLSVSFGFNNGIDPSIIAHPANCQLILQNANASKHTSCSITYEQLLQRINEWNVKYPTVRSTN